MKYLGLCFFLFPFCFQLGLLLIYFTFLRLGSETALRGSKRQKQLSLGLWKQNHCIGTTLSNTNSLGKFLIHSFLIHHAWSTHHSYQVF